MNIKDIINNMFYKDVASIIESYLFVECSYCKEEQLEDISFEMYDKKWICVDCRVKYRRNIRLCDNCIELYDLREVHSECLVCFNTCHTYCKDCAKKIYNEDNIISSLQHLDNYLTNTDTRELFIEILENIQVIVEDLSD